MKCDIIILFEFACVFIYFYFISIILLLLFFFKTNGKINIYGI